MTSSTEVMSLCTAFSSFSCALGHDAQGAPVLLSDHNLFGGKGVPVYTRLAAFRDDPTQVNPRRCTASAPNVGRRPQTQCYAAST